MPPQNLRCGSGLYATWDLPENCAYQKIINETSEDSALFFNFMLQAVKLQELFKSMADRVPVCWRP